MLTDETTNNYFFPFNNHGGMSSNNKKIFHSLLSTIIFYLCRRSVSTFLTSEVRDKIDRIMMSRPQAQPNKIVNELNTS